MLESTILMISDDPSLLETVGEVTQSHKSLRFIGLPTIDGACSYESWDDVALVIVHLRRQGPTSAVARLLRMISAARRPVATVVVGEQGDDEQAPALLRLGVADYLIRPVDVAWLSYLIETLTIRSRQSSLSTTPELTRREESGSVDPASADDTQEADPLMSQVRRVAPQEATILLSGETGTGKTWLARHIHELSSRRSEPFVTIKCGALSPNAIESEMFGLVRDSSTSAERDRAGKFAEVARGTLFLDEIDTLPMAIQSKLLRVVEDRVFEPIGSNRPQPIRARLIAASNRLLEEEVASQRFRSDLYYRLNVIGFHLPPLRERRGAIPALVSKFIGEFSGRNGGQVKTIAHDALEVIERYDWPGNIRELRNLIERSVALCSGPEIRIEELPDAIVRSRHALKEKSSTNPSILTVPAVSLTTLAQIKREAELARITEALAKHSNNRLRAASELGISRMTLYKKLYKYGLMQSNAATPDGVA